MCFNYHFHKKICCYKGRCVYSHFYKNISTLFFLNKSSIVLKEDVVLSLSLSYVYSYFLFLFKNLTLTFISLLYLSQKNFWCSEVRCWLGNIVCNFHAVASLKGNVKNTESFILEIFKDTWVMWPFFCLSVFDLIAGL